MRCNDLGCGKIS